MSTTRAMAQRPRQDTRVARVAKLGKRGWATSWGLALTLGVTLFLCAPSRAEAQGVRFTLAPEAAYTWWDTRLGIEDSPLYGGRVTADFGSRFTLGGYYHRGTNLGVTRDSLLGTGVPQLGPLRTTVDASAYGGSLAFRLSTGRLAPFLSVGAGVMQFNPDSLKRQEQINYRYGGGVHYDATSNIRATLSLEDSRFRLAPGALFTNTTGGTSRADRQTTRSNWTASAGLGIALGGEPSESREPTERWSLGSVPLEAFAGRLDFDDPALKRQALVGVRTGVDFGQFVGVRGFYMQGRSSNLRERESLQSYGGEAQFNLTRSRGPSPFLVLGASRLDFGNTFRDSAGQGREDETALIAGVGVAFRLTDNFRLNGAVRDFVRGPQDLDSIATTSQLTHNWLYTVGLGFDVGRSRARTPAKVSPEDASRRALRDREVRRARDERLRGDTLMVAGKSPTPTPGPGMILLPAPTVGELYIRYGDSTSRALRIASGEPVERQEAANATVSSLREEIARLEARAKTTDSASRVAGADAEIRALRARVDALQYEMRLAKSPAPQTSPTVMVLPPAPAVSPAAAPPVVALLPRPSGERQDSVIVVMTMPAAVSVSADRSSEAMRVHGVSPYIGGFGQTVLGAQLDLGPVFGIPSLRLVPDFAIGLSDGASVSLALGAQYDFPPLQIQTPGLFRPYLRGGLGFLAASGDRDSAFGVNAAYGLTYERPRDAKSSPTKQRPSQFFVEHQGIGFFSTNRFLLGMRFSTK